MEEEDVQTLSRKSEWTYELLVDVFKRNTVEGSVLRETAESAKWEHFLNFLKNVSSKFYSFSICVV